MYNVYSSLCIVKVAVEHTQCLFANTALCTHYQLIKLPRSEKSAQPESNEKSVCDSR
jgi:hypothetical protein